MERACSRRQWLQCARDVMRVTSWWRGLYISRESSKYYITYRDVRITLPLFSTSRHSPTHSSENGITSIETSIEASSLRGLKNVVIACLRDQILGSLSGKPLPIMTRSFQSARQLNVLLREVAVSYDDINPSSKQTVYFVIAGIVQVGKPLPFMALSGRCPSKGSGL